MATVQRYVNTASAGGDGTTNNTSGSTAAYASLASWEANAGGSASDDYIVDCCGTAADTTLVVVDWSPNTTTGSAQIRGNRDDPAGFYDGPLTISTSHYRLTAGNTVNAFRTNESNTTVDGIQLIAAHTSGSGAGMTYTTSGAVSFLNNRLLNTATTNTGIGRDGSSIGGSVTRRVENNLIVGFNDAQIRLEITSNFSPTHHILHNTCYGGLWGISVNRGSGSGNPTINVKGNAIAGASTSSIVEVGTNGTVNYADNATEDFDLGTTDEIDLGLTTDAWTDPGPDAGDDFTVKNTSSALYNAVNPTLVTTDITDFTRDGTNHDVGAFEYQAGGGGDPQLILPPAASLALTSYAPTVATTANVTSEVPLATLTVTTYAPSVIATDTQLVEVPAASLTVTAYAPTVSISNPVVVAVPAASLSVTTFAPSVLTTANVIVDVPAASVTLTEFTPTVLATANVKSEVPAASLTLTAYAPTINTVASVLVQVPAASLSLTTFAPTVSAIANILVEVPKATFTLSTFAPTINVAANKLVEVPLAALSLSTFVPSVAVTDHKIIAVPKAELTLTAFAPSVLANTVIQIPKAAITLTAYDPSVITTVSETGSMSFFWSIV